MEFHEYANLFPMMTPEEMQALKTDIRENGFRPQYPILLFENKILDGRNRYTAALAEGVEPIYGDYTGDDPLQYVISSNLNRRHLNESQRGVIAARLSNMERGEFHGNQYEVSANLHTPKTSQSEAAERLNVSARTVATAKKIEREAPELIPEIEAGILSLHKAGKIVNKRILERERPKVIFDGVVPKLYCGKADNLDFIESETIDMIITSPPYNLGDSNWPMGGNGATARLSGIGYSDAMPEDVYQEWQINCINEWYRVAKNGASLFYNHKVRQSEGTIIHPLDWLRNTKWIIRQEIIWDRGSTHNHAKTLFWQHDERIYWMTKGKPNLPDRSIGYPTILSIKGPIADTWHPAPFTEELPEICIKSIASDGAIILDPFGGSMTTCKVAGKLGFESIGVDIDNNYIEEAKKRNGWTNQ